MPSKTLKSWKLSKTSKPFYPFGVRCIGVGSSYAVTTWSAHTVEMLMFRNFHDAIRRDESAQKVYTHPTLETDHIVDIAVGGQNSVVQMQSGALKYFASRKKLENVEYLQNVRAICNCHDGFALIETAADGMDIFIEYHPDAFPRIDVDAVNQMKYDISMERNAAHSTWNDANFLIKDLPLAKAADNEAFMRLVLPGIEKDSANIQRPVLFVIDHNLLSFHIDAGNGSPCVHPLVSCSSKITNFWMTAQGNTIVMLLESGAIECLSFNMIEQRLATQKIYLNAMDEIVTSDFGANILTYSDGHKVYYGTLSCSQDGLFEYQSKAERICGVVALTILNESDIILCISENNLFYVISLAAGESDAPQWTEIDADAQQNLRRFKRTVFDLNETYQNLCKEIVLQQAMSVAATLRCQEEFSQKFFKAKVTAVRSLPDYSLAHATIYIANNTAVLTHRSYFLRIALLPARYASEFDSPIWSLRIRWNRRQSHMCQSYVNVKLLQNSLLKPLDIILHMQQDSNVFELPELQLDINAPICIGREFLYISFSVHVEQATIHDVIEIHSAKPVFYRFDSIDMDWPAALAAILPSKHMKTPSIRSLLYKIQLPTAITFDKIHTHNDFKRHLRPHLGVQQSHQSPTTFYVVILSATLEMAYHRGAHNLLLTTTNAGILYHIKKLIYRIIIDCLPDNRTFHLPTTIQNEYCVSISNVMQSPSAQIH